MFLKPIIKGICIGVILHAVGLELPQPEFFIAIIAWAVMVGMD